MKTSKFTQQMVMALRQAESEVPYRGAGTQSLT